VLVAIEKEGNSSTESLVEELLQLELSKITVAIIAFAFSALGAIILLPRVFGIPFGKTSFTNLARGIGFYLPKDGWKHIGLGLTLAACTLSGMLVGSILTGEYVIDASNITLSQRVHLRCLQDSIPRRRNHIPLLPRCPHVLRTESRKRALWPSATCFLLCGFRAAHSLWPSSRPGWGDGNLTLS